LTSHGERVTKTAPYAAYTLLRQSVRAGKVILWLARGTAIPPLLRRLQDNGLDIRFCKDMRAYTKLIPALAEFPGDILITADDDVYYPKRWLEGLKKAYMNDPSKIYCYRAHEIVVDEDGNIAPYNAWKHCMKNNSRAGRLFPTGVGGILYPPRSLGDLCLREEEFMKLAPDGDDIWFWAMAKCMGTKHEVIGNGRMRRIINVDPDEASKGLCLENVYNGGNDRQLKAILERFPAIKESLR
jgi:hypothetical protein